MARIRSIKPEFFTSLSIADLSIPAKLHFIGLWTHVDDEGRCIDDSRLIKAAVWPLQNDFGLDRIEELQDELHARGRIDRYVVLDRTYMQVIGWEHQKIDRKRASTLPAPSEGSMRPRRSLVEDSSPDLGILGSDLGIEDLSSPTKRSQHADNLTAEFDEFWKMYPRKDAKLDAEKAYRQARREITQEDLLAALIALIPSMTASGPQFVKQAGPWLRGKRWRDEPPATTNGATSSRAERIANQIKEEMGLP